MSPLIRITPSADRDADRQRDFLAQSSASVARRFQAALRQSYEGLAKSPRLGSPWETDRQEYAGMRFSSVQGFPNHLIFYRALEEEPGGIEVIRVLHAAQDLEAIFGTTEESTD